MGLFAYGEAIIFFLQKINLLVFIACNNSDSLTSSVNVVQNTAAADDDIEYTCNVTFASSGEIIPSIRWTSGDRTLTASKTDSANRVDSVYTVTAGTNSLPSIKCDVFFSVTTVSGPSSVAAVNVAQNTPSYTDSQSFAEIEVTCKYFCKLLLLFCVISAL